MAKKVSQISDVEAEQCLGHVHPACSCRCAFPVDGAGTAGRGSVFACGSATLPPVLLLLSLGVRVS